MYRLLLHKQVISFVYTRVPQEKKLIATKFELLKVNPRHHPGLDIKKMVGLDDVYRLRIGKYRFLYTIDDTKVLIFIMVASARGDVYNSI